MGAPPGGGISARCWSNVDGAILSGGTILSGGAIPSTS